MKFFKLMEGYTKIYNGIHKYLASGQGALAHTINYV
jgi:hypothetical protein